MIVCSEFDRREGWINELQTKVNGSEKCPPPPFIFNPPPIPYLPSYIVNKRQDLVLYVIQLLYQETTFLQSTNQHYVLRKTKGDPAVSGGDVGRTVQQDMLS